jgi:hypothetical protein
VTGATPLLLLLLLLPDALLLAAPTKWGSRGKPNATPVHAMDAVLLKQPPLLLLLLLLVVVVALLLPQLPLVAPRSCCSCQGHTSHSSDSSSTCTTSMVQEHTMRLNRGSNSCRG